MSRVSAQEQSVTKAKSDQSDRGWLCAGQSVSQKREHVGRTEGGTQEERVTHWELRGWGSASFCLLCRFAPPLPLLDLGLVPLASEPVSQPEMA